MSAAAEEGRRADCIAAALFLPTARKGAELTR